MVDHTGERVAEVIANWLSKNLENFKKEENAVIVLV